MGVYKRGRILWISYAGPNGETVRESTKQGDARVARRLYAARKREVAEGSWIPPKLRGPGGRVTVADYAARWIERQRDRDLQSIRSEEQRLRDHVLPLIGNARLETLKPKDVIRFVEELRRRQRADGEGLLAPRSVRHCYDILRRMCRDAVIDEVIPATPCVLPPRTLPAKRDRDPAWRATAVFTRSEVEALISDERVPWDRRVFYALAFLLGCRHGEAAGRRWEHYDAEARPLGRMMIATQYDDRALKVDTPREVPVHPTLAAILDRWRSEGFAMFFGRSPRSRDFIVPEVDASYHRRIGQHRLDGSSLRRLGYDLDKLGLRRRRQHDARRTLISIGRTDGCDRDILKACTHGDRREVFDQYTTWPWEAKCREVAKIRIHLPDCAVHNELHTGSAEAGVTREK